MTEPSNDTKPADVPLSLSDELAHAVMALAQHENQIKRMVMVRYPNGGGVPLGDLLMRFGQYVDDQERARIERSKPRLVLPSHLVR